MFVKLFVIGVCLLVPATSIADSYFQDRADGWFWYINPDIKMKPKVTPKNKSGFSSESVNDLREKAKKLLEQAVMKPSNENITAYLTVQKVILEKAETFAHKWKEVVWSTPELDYIAVHPVSNTGLNLYKQERNRQQEKELMGISQRSGIFFIFSSTCQYCIAQAGILKRFSEKYGFSVLPVTIDGKGLPEYPYPYMDNGTSEKLGVERTPSIFLVSPPDIIKPVSSGLLTFDELEKRISTLGRKLDYEKD